METVPDKLVPHGQTLAFLELLSEPKMLMIGLIMWMPVMEISRPETNGMMVARRSHRDHMEYIRNGTWDRHEGSTSGHLEFMRFWRHLGMTSETLAPTLNLGDVLVFSKVNSFTGKITVF